MLSGRYRKTEEEKDAPAELLQSVCLRRDQLAKWHYQPFFDKFAAGFLVRIGIGKSRAGDPVYRIAEIVEVKDGRYYFVSARMCYVRGFMCIGLFTWAYVRVCAYLRVCGLVRVLMCVCLCA